MNNTKSSSNVSMPIYHFTSPTGLDCNPFDPNGAIFYNGRQCMTQRIWPTRDDSLRISFFARGGNVKVKSIESCDMSATKLLK